MYHECGQKIHIEFNSKTLKKNNLEDGGGGRSIILNLICDNTDCNKLRLCWWYEHSHPNLIS
jgi:hypothetical protein